MNRAALAAVDKFTDPRGFKYPASVSMLVECLKPDIIRGLNVFIQLNYCMVSLVIYVYMCICIYIVHNNVYILYMNIDDI